MRRIVALLGAVALAAALSYPVSAAQPLHFDTYGFTEKQNPVEQQSDWPWLPGPNDCSANLHCVVNPTSCSWDVDDHWQRLALGGYLVSGASVIETTCLIVDANSQYLTMNGTTGWFSGFRNKYGVSIDAKSADLAVTVEWQPQGRTFTLAPVLDPGARLYRYRACISAAYDPRDPALGDIAGSNASSVEGSTDGRGVVSTITTTITNGGSRTARNISADISMTGTGLTSGCVAGVEWQYGYPFRWQ